MTLLTPERTVSTSARCDKIVSGSGVMSYHCTRPQGHMEYSGPPEDREPCYSAESPKQRKEWSDWRHRQNEREYEPDSIACPSCGGTMVLRTVDGNTVGECSDCHNVAALQADSFEGAQTAEEIEAEASRAPNWKVLDQPEQEPLGRPLDIHQYLAQMDSGVMHNPYGKNCRSHENYVLLGWGDDLHPDEVCVRCQVESQGEETETAEEREDPIGTVFVDPVAEDPRADHTVITAGDRNVSSYHPAPAAYAEAMMPTKQREGDQVLPQGGDRVVQDAKIAEEAGRIGLDSQIVAAIMEESKRVGISRYGQPLHTFDGRKNIRDLADELRDALVYVTKLQMTAEADRETLVRMVTMAMERADVESVDDFNHGLTMEALAWVAVDRILDWVLTQRIGPDQVAPVHGEPSS